MKTPGAPKAVADVARLKRGVQKLSAESVEALKREIASPSTQIPFVREVQAELINAGISPKVAVSSPAGKLSPELAGKVTAVLSALERKSKGEKLDLLSLSQNLGEFLGRLASAGIEAESAPPKARTPKAEAAADSGLPTPKLEVLGAATPNTSAPRELAPLRSYYPESALLPRFSGTAVGFDEAQVRFFFREYWDGPPNMSLTELVLKACKDEAFPELAKRISRGKPLSQEEIADFRDRVSRMLRLFSSGERVIEGAKLPGDGTPLSPFPWTWTGRTQVFTSHALVSKLLEMPSHQGLPTAIAELSSKHELEGGFPPGDTFRAWAKSIWLENPKDLAGREQFRFLSALPKESDGSFVLRGQQAAPAVLRDGHGRLQITKGLAEAVDRCAEDEAVKFGWSREQFVNYVNEKLGGGFTVNTFETLLGDEKTRDHVRSWTDMKKSAAERLAALVRKLHAPAGDLAAGIATATAMVKVLHEEHGYPLFPIVKLDYLRSYYGLEVPEFKAARIQRSTEKVQKVLEVATSTGEAVRTSAKKLGYDAKAASELLRTAQRKGLTTETARAKNPYTTAELESLKRMALELPIGAPAAEIYERLQREDAAFVARHPLSEARSIGSWVLQALGQESWTGFTHARLAKVFETVRLKAPRSGPTTWARMVRAEVEVRYSDEHLEKLVGELSRGVPTTKTPAVVEPPPPPVSEPLAAFAAWYPESQRKPNRAFMTLSAAAANAVHEAYWNLGPREGYPELFAALREKLGPDGFSEKHVRRLIAERKDCFPSDPRLRSFDFHSYLLVEELLRSPVTESFASIVERLRERHGHFPHEVQFRVSSRDTWLKSPERFPFLKEGARLPLREDGEGYDLRGQLGQSELAHVRGSQLVYSEELARAIEPLCFDPRIRFDWDMERFTDFLTKELGVPLNPSRLRVMRRDFVFPDLTDIRNTAKRNLAYLIRDIHSGEANDGVPVPKLEDVLDILHQKFGFPRYAQTLLWTLRAVPADEARGLPAARDIIPEFRELQREEALDSAERLLAEIKKTGTNGGFFAAGRRIGLTERQTINLLRIIRREWPDALPLVSDQYTKEEIEHLRAAVAECSIGATLPDLEAILRAQHPEIFERHDNPNIRDLIARHLDIPSFSAEQERRLREVFVHVAKDASPGVSLGELFQVIQNNYDLSYPRVSFERLVEKWSSDPENHPEVAALRIPGAGGYPWSYAEVSLSPELAQAVGAVLRASPKGLIADVVKELQKDPLFRTLYPWFRERHVFDLRERFGPEVIPLRAARVPFQTLNSSKDRALAEKIRQVAAETSNKNALTPTRLALELGVPVAQVLRTLRAHAELFPWHRGAGGKLDLTLAARVGRAIEEAPFGRSLEEVQEALWADPNFQAAYPSFSRETFSELRQQFPSIVPDWKTREQILATKTLVEALRTAPLNAPVEAIIHRLQQRYPDAYPSGDPSYYALLWRQDPTLLQFAAALRDGRGQLRLRALGQPASKESAAEQLSEANRLARELPQIPKDLPVTRALIDGVPKDRLKDCEVVCVQHLLGGMVPFMEICREIGVRPEQTTIVGVPYSTNRTVAQILDENGWPVRSPPLDMKQWKEMVREAMYERLEAALENGRQIVVLDDGGWAAKLLREDPYLRDHAHLFSIVEQTTRGITVADEGVLNSPLTSVAESLTKRFIEAHLLKSVLSDRLIKRLDRLGIKSVKGMKVGLIGKGALGSPLAEELKRQGAIVTIRDLDGKVIEEAVAQGYGDGSDAAKFFGGQDLILGVTGHESMGPDELAMVGHKTIIGSFSSKLVEIDVDHLADNSNGPPVILDRESRPPTVLYRMKDGREIRLLASGFPINFDGDVNSLDPIAVQVTRSLMLIGLLQAAGKKAAGVDRLDVARQIELVDLLRKVDLFREDPETLEVIDETRKKLVESLKTNAHSSRKRHKLPRPAPKAH